ncbi:MAG TPA: hypothetical protein VFH03_05145 [Actinoplanes sp.]|nr:hypothetical protein [Actinoplanes sp.]
MTMLLAVAAMFAWFGSSGCDPTAATADGQPSDRRPAAPSGEPDAQPLPNAGQGFAVVQRPG